MNRVWSPPERLWRGVGRSIRRTGAAALPLILLLAIGCAERSREAVGTRGDELRRFEPRWSHDPPWHPCDLPQVPGLRLVTCAPAPSLLAEVDEPQASDTRFRAIEELGASSFETEAIRRSLARLREERLRRRDDATVENDLAVALVVAAQAEASPVMLVQALGAIERARRFDPESEVIAFNRALVLGYLHLTEAAKEAWQDYLRLDPQSPWSIEARERLERVQARRAPGASQATDPAVNDPQRERHRLEVVVLEKWAELDDKTQARSFLEDQMPAVERLTAVTGDDLLLATYRLLLDSFEGNDVARQRDLLEGHRLVAEGRRAQDEGSFASSLPMLKHARSLLLRAGSPFWVWAEHGILRCAYQRSDFAEVEQVGQAILAASRTPSAIAARTWWLLGSARFGRGDFAAAEASFRKAADLFAVLGETPNRIAMDSMLAALHEWVGRREAAWEARHSVLAQLSDGHDPKRLRLVLVDAAMAAAELGEPEAALALQDHVVALAERENDPVSLANAFLKRGAILTGASVRARAQNEEDFARTAETIETIVDPDQLVALRAQLLLEWGKSDVSQGFGEAARQKLEEAVTIFGSGDSAHLWLPEANAALGQALAATEDGDGALSRFDAALVELGRQRRTVTGVFERILLADRADRIHEELLRLFLDRGEGRRALEEVRRARADSWLTRTAATTAIAGRRSPSAPGPDSATVTYAVLADRVALWLEKDSGLRLFQVNVPRQTVNDLISACREAIARRSDSALPLLRQLHRFLVEPIDSELHGIDHLIIEPDESLYGAPFAAFLDAEGSFLIERLGLSISSVQKQQPLLSSEAPRRLFAIADPAFPIARYPHLERLSSAREEAAAAAELYAEPTLLMGEEATAREMLRGIVDADVIHVAAHGLASTRDPLRSFLALAPGQGDDDGALTVEELLEAEPKAGLVVVLAACESAGGFIGKADGPVGLTWPFLARGASAVVATLWQIDDRAVGELVIRLHEGLGRAEAPEDALRSAQLSALRDQVDIGVWAPWVVVR